MGIPVLKVDGKVVLVAGRKEYDLKPTRTGRIRLARIIELANLSKQTVVPKKRNKKTPTDQTPRLILNALAQVSGKKEKCKAKRIKNIAAEYLRRTL